MAHSHETLVRMSGQLAHEIEMLTGTARYLREDALAESPDDRLTVRTAVSEAFTIHARTLIDFLRKKSKDEVVSAASYVPKWKSELPTSAVKKVPKGKHLVRLTTKRKQGATLDSDWHDGALVAALRGELLRFTEAVPEELVEPDFKSRAQVALEAPAEPEASVEVEVLEIDVLEVAPDAQLVGAVEVAEPVVEPEPVADAEPEPPAEIVPEPAAEVEPVAEATPAELQPDPLPEPDPFPDPMVTPPVPGLHRDEFGAVVFKPRNAG